MVDVIRSGELTMSKKFSSKWGRTITACSECHRRKQRCNRKRPCDTCIARNVQHHCTYGGCEDGQEIRRGDVRLLRPHLDPLPSVVSSFNEQEKISQSTQEASLGGKIGYSLQKETNALQSLQKSFRIPDEMIRLHDPLAMNSNNPLADLSLASHYRSLVALLPPLAISKALIDTYFDEVSWYSAQLDRYYFEADYALWQRTYNPAYMRDLSRDLQFFPALLFQVLAVAVQFLPPDKLTTSLLRIEDPANRERLSHRYSTAGTEIMALLKRHNPTLASIQHDQIRALWLKCCSRGTESWHSLSDAVRQAQDLGLHLQDEVLQGQNVGETLYRLWFDEHKRRIWVALFIADSHMSIILGRPRLINTSDCTVRPPLDCNIPSDPSTTIPGTIIPGTPPSHYSLSLFNYAIGQLFHETLSLGANKKNTQNYGSVRMLHEKVNVLLGDLPSVVRPLNPDTSWDVRAPGIPRQRKQIATVANSFLISLHREHVAVHAESRMAAVRAGLALLEAQRQIAPLIQPHHYRMYGLSCHTIDACMFLSAVVLDKETATGIDHTTLQEIVSALRKAIDHLNVMAFMSPMAKSGAELLERCLPKVQETVAGLYTNFSDLSSSTLSVGYQDHAKIQSSQTWPEVVGSVDTSLGEFPMSLDDFGGNQFRPDMFENFVTLGMGQEDYPAFEFDLTEADKSNFDSNPGAGHLAESAQLDFSSTVHSTMSDNVFLGQAV